MTCRIRDHVWLSGRKRDRVSPCLGLGLLAAAVCIGASVFAVFCGGLLCTLAAADRDGDGVAAPGFNLGALRTAGYCLIGCGSAALLVTGMAWLALVRLAHCQIRDQEHEVARSRYRFPGGGEPEQRGHSGDGGGGGGDGRGVEVAGVGVRPDGERLVL